MDNDAYEFMAKLIMNKVTEKHQSCKLPHDVINW